MAIFSRSETYGILDCGRLFTSRNAKRFSYNKRTTDRAMGPFWPLWQFLESIAYVFSIR